MLNIGCQKLDAESHNLKLLIIFLPIQMKPQCKITNIWGYFKE